jgi:hypothetical protein
MRHSQIVDCLLVESESIEQVGQTFFLSKKRRQKEKYQCKPVHGWSLLLLAVSYSQTVVTYSRRGTQNAKVTVAYETGRVAISLRLVHWVVSLIQAANSVELLVLYGGRTFEHLLDFIKLRIAYLRLKAVATVGGIVVCAESVRGTHATGTGASRLMLMQRVAQFIATPQVHVVQLETILFGTLLILYCTRRDRACSRRPARF